MDMNDIIRKRLRFTTSLKNIEETYIEAILNLSSVIKTKQGMIKSLDMFHRENTFNKDYLDITSS